MHDRLFMLAVMVAQSTALHCWQGDCIILQSPELLLHRVRVRQRRAQSTAHITRRRGSSPPWSARIPSEQVRSLSTRKGHCMQSILPVKLSRLGVVYMPCRKGDA